MRVSVSLTSSEPLPGDPGRWIAVVIDVLRASTTIVTAVQNGCSEVVPVASIDAARRAAASRPAAVLGGERGGRRIEGFDLGNSPSEYTRESVGGRALVLATTNGTVALDRYSRFERVIGCFANLLSIRSFFERISVEAGVHIVCAGKLGRAGLEDIACAGAMVSTMRLSRAGVECDDGAMTALALWKYFDEDPYRAVSESSHARYLCSIGLGRDVDLCSHIGDGPIPQMRAGAVTIPGSGGGAC